LATNSRSVGGKSVSSAAPETSSMVKNWILSASSTEKIVTMLGLLSAATVLASRWKRIERSRRKGHACA